MKTESLPKSPELTSGIQKNGVRTRLIGRRLKSRGIEGKKLFELCDWQNELGA